MKKPVQMVVVENFGSCNMRCSYCFPEHMWQREGFKGVMTDEVLRGALERTFAATSAEVVNVRFAGGEPLLAGQAWLESAMGLAHELAAAHGKRVIFSLQTNATLVTPELARFLTDRHVLVGVSLDGDRDINESVRGSTDRTLEGFRLLTEAAGRRPGVIVTVTKCNARRMREVVAYLEDLGVALFRANQMGATAPWNAHSAPRADDWAAARRDTFDEVAARGGRILEYNLSQSVLKFVKSTLKGVSPFESGNDGCCEMRCTAGRGLVYFDQKGMAYPCPRSNVTAGARIAHFADPDFDARWDETARELDAAMETPEDCRRCPAQFICDYGCHAFNVAQGNFFEVNCDATKEFFGHFAGRLEDVARLYYYVTWRERLRAADDYEAALRGTDVPADYVRELSEQLRAGLAGRLARPGLDPALLERRHGWRDALVPVQISRRPHTPA